MNKRMNKKNISDYHKDFIASLKDIDEAEAYLQVALAEYDDDGDYESFMLALKNLAEAQGGMQKLSRKAHLNRENLYRVLSHSGNPTLETLSKIIHALGFKLTVNKI